MKKSNAVFYQVYEVLESETGRRRLIYTFDDINAAYEMVEMILRNDLYRPVLTVEEYAVTT